MKFPTKKYNFSSKYFSDYSLNLKKTLQNKHFSSLSQIADLLEKKMINDNSIFICGNGGSASISNHFQCDFNKGIKISSKRKIYPKVVSLVNSIELITAISNDISYSKSFSFQLENYAKKNDLLFVLSCSGNSKNIIEIVKFAKKKKLDIVSILGFSKHKSFLDNNSKYSINLGMKNYGITEDIFQIYMHMISQYLRQKFQYFKSEIL